MSPADPQVCLLVNEDAHRVKRVDKDPLSQIELSPVRLIRILMFLRGDTVLRRGWSLLLFRGKGWTTVLFAVPSRWKLGQGVFVEQKGAFNVLLDDFGTHVLLAVSIEKFAETAKAEYTDTSRCKGRLTDPNVLLAIYLAVLRVHVCFELLVHLVGLIHDVYVWYFPAVKL